MLTIPEKSVEPTNPVSIACGWLGGGVVTYLVLKKNPFGPRTRDLKLCVLMIKLPVHAVCTPLQPEPGSVRVIWWNRAWEPRTVLGVLVTFEAVLHGVKPRVES